MKININKRRTCVYVSIIVATTTLIGCSKNVEQTLSQESEVSIQSQITTQENEKLVEAILKESGLTKENNNRYTYFNVNLKGTQSENEVIAYLWGDDFSGTGGGTMMIFDNVDGEYKFISKSTVVSFPIYIIQDQTNGYYDIVVTSSGGGTSTKTTVLKYENDKYTLNSSTAPEIDKDDVVVLRTLQYEVKSDGGYKLK